MNRGGVVIHGSSKHDVTVGRIKIGQFNYDTSTVSGNQSITGVGFTPRLLILYAVVGSGAGEMSIGFSNAVNHYSMSDAYNLLANAYINGASSCVYLTQTGGMTVSAVVNSMDSDGFTLGWTKGGAKTGSSSIIYIALG